MTMDFIENERIEKLHDRVRNIGSNLAVAESCTGGLIGGAITSIPGSSDVFEGGVIAYSNEIKREQLGVSNSSLEEHGAVSKEVARRMVEELCHRYEVELGVSVTGIAGPSGGTEEKPVGLVYSGIATGSRIEVFRHVFEGDRASVREETVRTVLDKLLDHLPMIDH
jgi:PncC family amidohydrolase